MTVAHYEDKVEATVLLHCSSTTNVMTVSGLELFCAIGVLPMETSFPIWLSHDFGQEILEHTSVQVGVSNFDNLCRFFSFLNLGENFTGTAFNEPICDVHSK